MKKLAYETPIVEVTKWNTSDIITTSGLTASDTILSASNIGDTNSTAVIDYKTTLGQ